MDGGYLLSLLGWVKCLFLPSVCSYKRSCQRVSVPVHDPGGSTLAKEKVVSISSGSFGGRTSQTYNDPDPDTEPACAALCEKVSRGG